jgi:hypothetical protein
LRRLRPTVHPIVVGNGARRLRRFDVAHCPDVGEFSKFVGSVRLKAALPRTDNLWMHCAPEGKVKSFEPAPSEKHQTPENFQIANPKIHAGANGAQVGF